MHKETAVFGAGCFWCVEAVFQNLKGVSSVLPGYAGGHKDNPTYEEVSSGDTGYAEVTKIEFDPSIIGYQDLLNVRFATHDPTTMNKQGNDVGEQYRSAIFYTTARQKEMSEHYIRNIQHGLSNKIVTTVEPLEMFYKAEDYHQKYYETHKDAGYCQLIITPKVEKVQTKFKSLLK